VAQAVKKVLRAFASELSKGSGLDGEETREPLVNQTSDGRVSDSLGTIGVVVRAVRTISVISIVASIGRIVVRAFALCTTFTFV